MRHFPLAGLALAVLSLIWLSPAAAAPSVHTINNVTIDGSINWMPGQTANLVACQRRCKPIGAGVYEASKKRCGCTGTVKGLKPTQGTHAVLWVRDNARLKGLRAVTKRGHDLPGNDLRRIKGVPRLEVCRQLCAAESACYGVAYSEGAKTCWLKDRNRRLVKRKKGIDASFFRWNRSKAPQVAYVGPVGGDVQGTVLRRVPVRGDLKARKAACAKVCKGGRCAGSVLDRKTCTVFRSLNARQDFKINLTNGAQTADTLKHVFVALQPMQRDKWAALAMSHLKCHNNKGNDLRKTRTHDIGACRTLCAINDRCVGINFEHNKKSCWLEKKHTKPKRLKVCNTHSEWVFGDARP